MPVPFTKWSVRIASLIVWIAIVSIVVVRFLYPGSNEFLTTVQSIITTAFAGYILFYVSADWWKEIFERKLRVVRK